MSITERLTSFKSQLIEQQNKVKQFINESINDHKQ